MIARLASVLLLAGLLACGPGPSLVGEPLASPLAPNFTLTDGPTGAVVTLTSLRGRVVVLTFLYTSCPDVCPLTAETLRHARDLLGQDAPGIALVAVSVDPAHDTPAATQRFVAEHRLEGVLRYLIGSRAELARVWFAYSVAQVESGAAVGHTDVIYLIDKSQRGRVLLHSDVTADVLAADLRILLRER